MNINILKILFLIVCLSLTQLSCKKFLEIDPPVSALVQETVFLNNEVATSAVTGIYTAMAANGYASGGQGSITVYGGLSSDEFKGYRAGLIEFADNQITATNTEINNMWTQVYQRIYATNAVLEGLEVATNVSAPVKTQLMGEALFLRAFNYFYLVNLFGPVPLNLSTDYRINQVASRMSIPQIYQQILKDLKMAEEMLTDSYPTGERIRPNVSGVRALLARTYLYLQDWANAEKYSTLVMEKTMYNLVNLDDVFLKNSNETIWQLMPTAGTNSLEGNLFILTAVPVVVSLNESFAINAFEINDKRKTSWVKTFNNAAGSFYYPNKYKIKSSGTVTEYSMVLRLAEQYLIRAEARVQQNNMEGAIKDIDAIRARAGLPLIKNINPNISKQSLQDAIHRERRVELFSEWGHRWFDLKRTEKATTILSPIKPGWQSFDVYYPISQTEVSRNLHISQNEGY